MHVEDNIFEIVWLRLAKLVKLDFTGGKSCEHAIWKYGVKMRI
jgi:hypothetical protein